MLLIIANVIVWGVALVISATKIKGVVKWYSIPAAFISLYIFTIYACSLFGIIPEYEIRFYLRWFNIVIAAYMILRSKHD